MRREERLAALIGIVRDRRLHRARDLAEALEVSIRTIYRDIDSLAASGVPIDGERGVGYILREPVFLPPMALSRVEMEALSLGMAIVREAADDDLRRAAQGVLDKVAAHGSNRRDAPGSWGFGIHAFERTRADLGPMPLLRRAIREKLVLRIDYLSLADATSTRVIRPLQIEYWGRVWTCSAWCETRGDFRAFRIDRIERCEETGARFVPEAGRTLGDYLAKVAAEMASSP